MTQPSDRQWLKPDDVLVRDLGGESVLLNLASESYFGMDDVGTRMWAALTEGRTLDAAFAILLAEYDVEPGTLRSDLESFVHQLAAAGLIKIVDA